ncbi:MAG: endonuclease/exonuclease/phosphatase family protein [Flavobacteriales bacterium]|nr:endonuclease/exonuclease/phosphatase family protein [Flavobacteriales bacterium]
MSNPRAFTELRWMALFLLTATGLAFAPDAYLPMLARAFMLQWCVGFICVSALLIWSRRWWMAFTALFCAALLAPQISAPEQAAFVTTDGTKLKVLHMNVLQPNSAFDAAISGALKSGADVISVQEVGPEWGEALRSGLCTTYPYVHIEPRTNCYGIALFSKRPFTRVGTIVVLGSPFIEAMIEVDGRPLRLLAVHATSPISYAHFKRRNRQLDHLARYIAQSGTATLLVGDLNTVPWDSAFERFCIQAGLAPTTGVDQRTWPSIGTLALIPLDHLLISRSISTSSITTVHIPGSDHRGLLAEVNIASHAS